MSTSAPKQPRERKPANKLVMRDASAHPDHRFVERYLELGLIEDAAILQAWTPGNRNIETAARRQITNIHTGVLK